VLPDRGLLEAHRCGWSPPAPGLIEATMTAVPDACFQDRFDDVVRAGYLPVAIDGYNVGSGVFYNVVFRPGRPATAAFAGLTASAYQAKFDSFAAQGYRLIHVDSFLRNGAVRYAAVWTKEAGPAYVAYHGLTRNQHQKRFDSLTAKGFRPTVISVVAPGGKLRVTALYVKRNVGGFVSVANVKVSKFQAEFNKRTGQGLKPTYVDGYTISGKPYFSVIFTGKASGNYVMRHGMTASKLAARAIQQRGAGRLTVALTGYQSGGAARFAAIWRK
jgi:hypothetical protein